MEWGFVCMHMHRLPGMRMERLMKYKKGITYRYDILSQHRLSTTISSKHWALLQKYMEKSGTQQKALEMALDSLETVNSKSVSKLSPEEETWMRVGGLNLVCLVQKEMLNVILKTVDMGQIEAYVKDMKPFEYVVEFFYQKPLKECSMKEIIDAIIINAKISHWFETVNYTDEDKYYTLNAVHDMGLNSSKINSLFVENLFKTYGAKTESTISERTIFIKVYKK
jgi:hypothetical protein